MLDKEKLKYWLAWNRLPHIGPLRFKKIYHHFTDLSKAWEADIPALKRAGLEQAMCELIMSERQSISPDALVDELDKHHLKALCLAEESYPALLKEIYDPPPVLYYKGEWEDNILTLAIVGTRKISTYGSQVVREIVPALVGQQLTTVSGLALGVDALVHEETVKAGGRTVAVLGSGLDQQNIYPTSNRYLSEKIITNGGCLFSEYPPGTLPLKQHFPHRNRIISGLSRGVLVIEGGETSGSLITARLALEQNREVLAVPGSIYAENSLGPNLLIKQGAKTVTSWHDIMECLELKELQQPANTDLPELDSTEQTIYDLLTQEPQSTDILIRLSKLTAAQMQGALSLLEMKGLVRNVGNNMFIRLRK